MGSKSRLRLADSELRLDSIAHVASAAGRRSVARRRSEASRFEGELARRIVENLTDSAVVVLDRADVIVHWNHGAERLFTYKAGEVVGRTRSLLFADEVFCRGDAPSETNEVEVVAIRSDGSRFPVRVKCLPLHDLYGSGSVALLVHDLSGSLRSEDLLRARFAEAAHLARLSTVGQMTAELVHEINQPLAAAANYARACVNFGRSGRAVIAPEVLDWMERSAAQALRAIQISKRLGSFVKRDDGRHSWVQINSLVEQSTAMIRSTLLNGDAAPNAIAIEADFALPSPEVMADQVQLEQVLLNLLRNAVEAMHEVRGRRHVMTIRTAVDAGFASVTVADTGSGIAPDKLAGLFDPFFTTKPNGLGLGLSISRAIIERHGGRMTVESNQSGTAFSFTLPLSPGGPHPC